MSVVVCILQRFNFLSSWLLTLQIKLSSHIFRSLDHAFSKLKWIKTNKIHKQSEQYIKDINAASTCFGAVHAQSSGNSQLLIKYVYANVMGAEGSESGRCVPCVRSVEDA
jgi:hypothetical protein